jgi:ribosomal-protein-alanine N-acetyltransferase
MADDIDELDFRQARPDEAPLLAAMDRACFPSYPFPEPYIHWHLEMGVPCPVCVSPGGELIGFAMMDMDPRSATGLLTTIDIAPAWRRRGIGKALVGLCARRLLEEGGRRILITVASQNEPAIAFYEALGFTHAGRLPMYYPDDDALMMVHGSPGGLARLGPPKAI